jgi:hypothetical protein
LVQRLSIWSTKEALFFEKNTMQTNPDTPAIDPEANIEPASSENGLDPEIVRMLAPTIEAVVRDTIRNDPKWVSDTIMPGLGPAIRKTVADSFRHLIEQVNDALDYSLSREGLRWRFEAARSGRSFAEIVLYNTLIYRVEQVLLIHSKSGLLINHVNAEGGEEGHADLVSSMLTAIQDFARDAFDAQDGDVLKTMEVGELKVWIHGGKDALLAAVIRGNAPRDYRTRLEQLLESILLKYAKELSDYGGDSLPFETVTPLLEGCLLEERRKPRKSLPLLVSIASLLVIGLGTFVTLDIRDRMRWSRYFESLDQTPGIIVSEVYRRGNEYSLTGLRDPLSANPRATLASTGLDTNRVDFRWEAYNALSAEFILARAYEALNPPDTVSISLVGNVLVATGDAPRNWIREASLLSKALPGVSTFDDSDLIDMDTSEYEILVWEFKEKSFRQTRSQIEGVVLDYTPRDKSRARVLKSDLEALRDHLVKLEGLARFLNMHVEIEVVALMTEDAGSASTLQEAGAKATKVRDALVDAGVSELTIKAKSERTPSAYSQTSPVIVRVVELSTLQPDRS